MVFGPYKDAVGDAFGVDVDYAMLVKMYSDSFIPSPYRTPEPHDAHAATAIHSPNQRFLKKAGEYEGGLVFAPCLV